METTGGNFSYAYFIVLRSKADFRLYRRQRTTISPAFQFDYLKSLVPIFIEHTKVLIDLLGDKQEKTDMKMWLQKLSLDILGMVFSSHFIFKKRSLLTNTRSCSIWF